MVSRGSGLSQDGHMILYTTLGDGHSIIVHMSNMKHVYIEYQLWDKLEVSCDSHLKKCHMIIEYRLHESLDYVHQFCAFWPPSEVLAQDQRSNRRRGRR